ncbi:thiol reductant ABC exporter subunit CydD [Nocardioides aquaticus]|uniref:thiol reductant ABC exporter subunit CydD n=1 Tax=Nocardioides aquaticus TaxID=160826 RepID=UPI0031D0D8CE
MRPTDPRLRAGLAPARRPLTGVVVAGVVGSVLVITQAWAVTGLVLAVVAGADLTRWVAVVVVAFALRGATGWVSDVLAARAAVLVGADLRRRVVAAYLVQRTTGGPSSSTGELALLATRGVAASEPYLTRYLPAVVLAGVLPLLTLVTIAAQDLLSAVVVAATLPLVPLFGALVGLRTRDRAREQWRLMASLSGHFLDLVRGLPTLVAFSRARAQSPRIAEITDRYRRASMSTLRVAFASSAVLELVATLSVALVAVLVGLRLAAGGLDLRTALFVLLLAPEAYWPLRRVGAEFHAAAEGVATFEAVEQLTESSAAAADDASTVPPVAGADLVLDDVSVRYPGRTTPALAHVTGVVASRGVTVVRGPSGCGKSTLLAAVAGLLPTASGSVRVGGATVGGEEWRSRIAWLPQRPVFVSGSVAENLRIAAPDAADEQLWSALRRVALEERVRALPGGLAEPVGDSGTTLSAGERARLALARVLVTDRPWVLLDEPTAHLDALTEQVVADTVVELGRTRAVLVVAHRPAIVRLADAELVLPAARPAPRVVPPRAPDVPLRVAAPDDQPAPPEPPRSLVLSVVLGALAATSGVALTATAGWLIVQASTRPAILTLMVAIVGVRAFGLGRPVLRYAERLRSHDVALRLLAAERVRVYDAVVPLTPGRLGRRRGDVLTSIVDDVDSVVDRQLRVRLPLAVLVAVAGAVATGAALVLPAAGLIVALTCVLAGGGGFVVSRVGAGRAERDGVARRADLSAAVVEVGQLAPELVMWQADGLALERIAAAGRPLGEASVGAARWWAGARALVLLCHGAGVAATAAVVTPAVMSGAISGPLAALLVLVPLALAEVTSPAADAGALSARTDAAARRLTALERSAPAVRDTVVTSAPTSTTLALRGVSAGWDRTRPAVDHLSLDVPRGARVGIVGESGSGKSTVAALMIRFLDPSAGQVTLGGAPLPGLALDEVRHQVGLVDDDPHVFATTLVENVRLARPAASDAEVARAVRAARLGPWLDSLPEGLHTWLGDGHGAVSGGERARIAVARSILGDQAVLVLDEPTAHLDHDTAADLAHEVLAGDPGRSVVWISHDRVGLDLVDRVVELGPPRWDERLGAPR